MKKTLYYFKTNAGHFIIGDKALRIAFVIVNAIELATIIYLLVR